MHKIIENLYQGNWDDALRVSKDKSIDLLIYLGQELPRELSHESKIPVIHIPIKDGKDRENKWETVVGIIIKYMKRSNMKILVACRLGLSRSPMAIIYYLVQGLCFDFDKAYNQVKKEIPEMIPAPALYSQIQRMSRSNYESCLD